MSCLSAHSRTISDTKMKSYGIPSLWVPNIYSDTILLQDSTGQPQQSSTPILLETLPVCANA